MRFNLILGCIWLLAGLPLLVVNLTDREMFGLAPSANSLTVSIMALLLALYNFARWWASRTFARQRAKSAAPVRKRVDGPTLEYNPQFDFSRPGPQTLDADKDRPKP